MMFVDRFTEPMRVLQQRLEALIPEGTPNPLRDDGMYPVLVSPGVFEALVDRVEWGEPDDDGFYTPTLYSRTEVEA
jgi:hypothetical protein